MADPVGDLIGDYRAFATQQRDRLLERGIDIGPCSLSHLAVRVAEWDDYVRVRTLLEHHAVTNSENVWNGRPISLIVLAEPLEVLDGKEVPLIELIPPVHQRVYKMGLEHLGVVVGDTFDAFVERHKPVHPSSWTQVRSGTGSTTSTTGCPNASSRPPARTRCLAERSAAACACVRSGRSPSPGSARRPSS